MSKSDNRSNPNCLNPESGVGPAISAPNDLDIRMLTHKFCKLWGIEKVAKNIRVEFSNRITRSLGRTQSAANHVRLNPQLKTCSKVLFEETLCHELAHIAAHRKFGDSIRPHGPEWQSLVRDAGYKPTLRLDVQLEGVSKQQTKCYIHRCPVCQSVRSAKKSMKRWRCRECVENGLPGILVIEETT